LKDATEIYLNNEEYIN